MTKFRELVGQAIGEASMCWSGDGNLGFGRFWSVMRKKSNAYQNVKGRVCK